MLLLQSKARPLSLPMSNTKLCSNIYRSAKPAVQVYHVGMGFPVRGTGGCCCHREGSGGGYWNSEHMTHVHSRWRALRTPEGERGLGARVSSHSSALCDRHSLPLESLQTPCVMHSYSTCSVCTSSKSNMQMDAEGSPNWQLLSPHSLMCSFILERASCLACTHAGITRSR